MPLPLHRERLALAGLWTLTLAPVLAHGIWRPVLQALGADGDAVAVTWAALAVAATAIALRIGSTPAALRAGAPLGVAVLGALLAGGSTTAALAALIPVALGATLALPRLLRAVPPHLDGHARQRPKTTAALVVLGLATLVVTSRVSTFIGDARLTHLSITDLYSPPYTHHACSTAYFQAAALAEQRVENLYDADWWPSVGHTPRGEEQALAYAPFGLDAYAYPPPFLVVPEALRLLVHDYAAQRALWFGLNGLLAALGLWVLVAFVGRTHPRAAARALVLAPLVWLSGPTIISLQVGNVHFALMALSIVAMVAFERQHHALGGALLALVILAKISPGVLALYLVLQKRWRPVLWTAGFGVVWSAIALAAFGMRPFVAFVTYELPRLNTGAALEFFSDNVREIASNMAPFGLPLKLQGMGLDLGDPWVLSGRIGLVYTLVLVGLVVVAARRRADPLLRAGLWLAILTLGALRSPFAPPYVILTGLWLFTLWAAEVRSVRGAVAVGVAQVAFIVMPWPDALIFPVSIAQHLAFLAAIIGFVVRPTPFSQGEADTAS